MTHKEIIQMIREDWFRDNRIKRYEPGSADGELLDWKQPESNMYRIIYRTWHNTLTVIGDVGDAIYIWSEPVTLKWISQTHYDYFASKCVASEYGRGYENWDQDHAKTFLQSQIVSYTEDDPVYWGPKMQRAISEYNIFDHLYDQYEWSMWLNEYGYDTFGDICEIAEIGMRISSRCIGHLEGLKMAFEIKGCAEKVP